MKILCTSKQLLGQRENQEDYIQYLSTSPEDGDENESLLLLADGMGGYAGGEKASHLVVEQFIDTYQQQSGSVVESLKQALDESNNALAAAVEAEPEYRGMGCTLIAVHIKGMQLHWLSVGDSPFWLYRDKKLMRLNQDHSMAAIYARMVEIGQMSEEDARNEPMRNSLRSVVKGEEIPIIDLPESHFELQKGDILLLASDGLETLTTTQITAILKRHHDNDLESLCDDLLAAVSAENSPVQDNTSIIAYKVATSNAKTVDDSRSKSWYSNTLTLLLVVAFSLSALIVFLLLQFNPDVLDNPTATKQPQQLPVKTKLPTPVLTKPTNTTQTEPKPADNPRVLQAPVNSGKPLDNATSSQSKGKSTTTSKSTEEIDTIKPTLENENEETPIGIENLDGFSEPSPDIPDPEIEEQPTLPPPPVLDNIPPPLIVESSPLSGDNHAHIPDNSARTSTDPALKQPRTFSQ